MFHTRPSRSTTATGRQARRRKYRAALDEEVRVIERAQIGVDDRGLRILAHPRRPHHMTGPLEFAVRHV